MLLCRALSITGQTITLIKGVSVSSDGACQLSGKRGRAETLPGTCTFTEKGASSPDGQRVLLKQGAQGPAGRRRFVAWDVSQAVAAGTFKVLGADEQCDEVQPAAALPGMGW